MPINPIDLIKEHWPKGTALIAVVFQTALAFQKDLAEISLTVRFLIGGAAAVWSTFTVANLLRQEPAKVSTGFGKTSDAPRKTRWWYAVRVFSIVVMSGLSIFLLMQIATFHSVRIFERNSSADPAIGTIEIQPAHHSVSLKLDLSTNQIQSVTIEDIAPASWNNNDPVQWGVQNQSKYGITLVLQHFKSPKVFGVWYRLSAENGKIEVDLNSDSEVEIIRGGKLSEYERNIWIFGGILCIAALLFWAYRSSWFRSSL
jgi:hypothetical protein